MMKSESILFLVVISTAFWMLCCSGTQGNHSSRPVLPLNPKCPLTLGPEDVITINVVGEKEMSTDYQADTKGYITFPWIKRININGKTNTDLAAYITKALVDGELILDPQVSVVIKEHKSARILVEGSVADPGAFPFRTGMTIREAISQAGGQTRMADKRRVDLARKNYKKAIPVPIREIRTGEHPDVKLCPGDSIYAPESVW